MERNTSTVKTPAAARPRRAKLSPVSAAPAYGKRAPIRHSVKGMKLVELGDTPQGGILLPSSRGQKTAVFPTLRSAERAVKRTVEYVNRYRESVRDPLATSADYTIQRLVAEVA